MKRVFVTLMVLVFALGISACGGLQDYPSMGRGKLRLTDVSQMPAAPSENNSALENVVFYEDDEYQYSYDTEREILLTAFTKTEVLNSIDQEDKAEIALDDVLFLLFPGKSLEELEIVEEGPGKITVCEYEGDILLNSAWISFEQGTVFSGAHRSRNIMPEEVTVNVDKDTAICIALEHMGGEKAFDEVKNEKMVYIDKLVWHLEGRIEQGHMDTYANFYIDMEDGSILDVFIASSE